VIGAQTAGLAAATEARRRNPSLAGHRGGPGRHPAVATCGLPWLFRGDSAAMVLHPPEELARRYRLDLRMDHEVIGLDFARRLVRCRRADGTLQEIPFRRLVIATGARPRVPPEILAGPASNTFTLRGVTDAEASANSSPPGIPAARPSWERPAGLEMADAFRRLGLEVTLLEQADQPLPGVIPPLAEALRQVLAAQAVDFRPRTRVLAVRPAGAGIALELNDGSAWNRICCFTPPGSGRTPRSSGSIPSVSTRRGIWR